MEDLKQLFFNDNYRLLKYLQTSEVNVGTECFIPLTQNEIAKAMKFSIMKTNSIMVRLKEHKLISMYNNSKGRYVLSEEAEELLKKIDAMTSREDSKNAIK